MSGTGWLEIACERDLVAVARRFARNVVAGFVPEEKADSAELLVSELVTNAVRFAERAGPPVVGRPAVRVEVECSPHYVHLRVRDPYPGPPERRRAGELDESGRGLAITDAVADAWWVESREHDKTLHAVLLIAPDEIAPDEIAPDEIAPGKLTPDKLTPDEESAR